MQNPLASSFACVTLNLDCAGKDPNKKSLRISGPLLTKLSLFIRKKLARQQKVNSNRTTALQQKLAAAAAAAAGRVWVHCW